MLMQVIFLTRAIASATWSSNLDVLLFLAPCTAAYIFIAAFTNLESRQERGA